MPKLPSFLQFPETLNILLTLKPSKLLFEVNPLDQKHEIKYEFEQHLTAYDLSIIIE